MTKEIDMYLADVARHDVGQHLTAGRNEDTIDRLKSEMSEEEFNKAERRASKFARTVLKNISRDVLHMPAYTRRGPHILNPRIDDATLDLVNIKISDTALEVVRSTHVIGGADGEDWLSVAPLYSEPVPTPFKDKYSL